MAGKGSKSFTALAVMQLAEAGTVDLDAPVRRYIPWFGWPTRKRPVRSASVIC